MKRLVSILIIFTILCSASYNIVFAASYSWNRNNFEAARYQHYKWQYYSSREHKVEKVLQRAESYIGVPYVWGGVSAHGFDCSGFTHYVLLKNNIIVPRTAAGQYKVGSYVPRNKLIPGDLIFFSTYKRGASHVGIYLGNHKFIQASSGWGHITVSDLRNNYYTNHYLGAKRVIK
jgi:cell wall-associated NlpC family hydrolase